MFCHSEAFHSASASRAQTRSRRSARPQCSALRHGKLQPSQSARSATPSPYPAPRHSPLSTPCTSGARNEAGRQRGREEQRAEDQPEGGERAEEPSPRPCRHVIAALPSPVPLQKCPRRPLCRNRNVLDGPVRFDALSAATLPREAPCARSSFTPPAPPAPSGPDDAGPMRGAPFLNLVLAIWLVLMIGWLLIIGQPDPLAHRACDHRGLCADNRRRPALERVPRLWGACPRLCCAMALCCWGSPWRSQHLRLWCRSR